MNPKRMQIENWESELKINEMLFLVFLSGLNPIAIDTSIKKSVKRMIIWASGKFCPKTRAELIIKSLIVVKIL